MVKKTPSYLSKIKAELMGKLNAKTTNSNLHSISKNLHASMLDRAILTRTLTLGSCVIQHTAM